MGSESINPEKSRLNHGAFLALFILYKVLSLRETDGRSPKKMERYLILNGRRSMPHAKLFFSLFLSSTLLSTSYSLALTDEQAKSLVAESSTEAARTNEQRLIEMTILLNEVTRLQSDVDQAKAAVKNDQTNRNISFGVTLAGAALLGYINFRPLRVDPNLQEAKNKVYSAIVALPTLAFGASGTGFAYAINIDRAKLGVFEKQLAEAKENILKHSN